MSRYCDEYDGDEPFPNASALWQHSAELALKGRRGRKALRELREALLALPNKRLVAGALCTVNPAERRPEKRIVNIPQTDTKPAWHYEDDWQGQHFDEIVQEQGQGVCAIGALLWHRKVKDGMDPDQAFAELPTVDGYNDDGLYETAKIAKADAGLAYSLAWRLAYRNDETLDGCTPEERYTKFLAWIDTELAEAPA
jgi:hypothetical protein